MSVLGQDGGLVQEIALTSIECIDARVAELREEASHYFLMPMWVKCELRQLSELRHRYEFGDLSVRKEGLNDRYQGWHWAV